METKPDNKQIKQQIQEDYSRTVAAFGQHIYGIVVPFLEALEMASKVLNLNRRMHAVLEDEKKEQKLQAVPAAVEPTPEVK